MEMMCMGILGGAIMCLIIFTAGVCYGERDNKGQSGNDSDDDLHTDGRVRDRSGDNGRTERMDAEKVINGLQCLRMALSNREKEYLDYACECVLIRQKLTEFYAKKYAEMEEQERKQGKL